MSEHPTLSAGACLRLVSSNDDLSSSFQPVLQCLSLKKLASAATAPNAPDRYRMIMSDGEHFIQSMLNTRLNYLVDNESLGKNTVFKLEQIANNFVQNKRLIIVMQIDVESIAQIAERLGNPQSLEVKGDPALLATAASASTSAQTTPVAPPAKTFPAALASHNTVSGEKAPVVYPIEGLSPYQNKWTIRARVTQKSDIKTWSNTKGEGKLFSCTLMDETGEIKATAFNAAVDEHFEHLHEGRVYYVSRARVNVAKKKFSNLNNEYEITLDKTTEIRECTETVNLPTVKYNFVELSQMENMQKDSTCDVLAIIHEVGNLSEIVSKTTNKPITKRELVIVDKSEYSIRMTLWGKQAETFEALNNPVVAFKGVKVGDYGGRTLSMFSSSTMTVDPDIPEAHMLRGWYDNMGSTSSFRAQSSGGGGGGGMGSTAFNRNEVKSISVVTDTLQGLGDKPDYFSTRAIILHVRPDNLWYTSCPGVGCQKKVTEQGDGEWRCEKCAKSYDHCDYRYLLSLSAADHTGQLWLQGFNDVAEQLLGITAKELNTLQEEDAEAASAKISGAVGKTWNFSCRVKQETFNDITRARYGINKAFPFDFGQEGLALLDQVKKYPASVNA